MKKNNFSEKGFDEMQILARGKGFKFAYLTAIIVLAVLTCLDELSKYVNPFSEFVITTWASITVFSIYTITHNAYDRINDTKTGKVVFSIFGITGIAVLAISLIRMSDLKENLLSHISVGIFLIINCAVYFIYHFVHNDNED